MPPPNHPRNKATPSRDGASAIQVLRLRSGHKHQHSADVVAREEPLEIRVQGRSVAVTMRTPGHDRELAAGFLVTEGVLRNRREVIAIAPCQRGAQPENRLNVFLAAGAKVDFKRLTRHVFATSSCGLCGKASIEAVQQRFPAITANLKVAASVLAALPEKMRSAQPTFARTGGLHAAAIFDVNGKLLVLREDVGRHNAVDKVLGWAFLKNISLEESMLLVSGRASFEILQKSLAGRIPIVCAISAPSSLAVEFACESGQTLVGFLRGKTMNVYSSQERIENGKGKSSS